MIDFYEINRYFKYRAEALEEGPEGLGYRQRQPTSALAPCEVNKMDNIVNVISSVGFPIAMCLLLFWYMQKESENHKTETNSLKDAINKLELAITTLVEKLEK